MNEWRLPTSNEIWEYNKENGVGYKCYWTKRLSNNKAIRYCVDSMKIGIIPKNTVHGILLVREMVKGGDKEWKELSRRGTWTKAVEEAEILNQITRGETKNPISKMFSGLLKKRQVAR
jgi:hypothetical protein